MNDGGVSQGGRSFRRPGKTPTAKGSQPWGENVLHPMMYEDVSWGGTLGRMAAQRIGPPTGRTVVLLPGFTCTAADWPRPMLERLLTLGFQVEALEWPDSGRSDRLAAGSYGIADLARQARDYAAANLRGAETHWLGLSMGSLVAQEMARLASPPSAASYTLLFTSAGSWSHGFGRLSTMARLLGVRTETSPEEVTFTLSALREELAHRPSERDMAELRRRVQASVKRAWPYERGPMRQLAAVTDYFAGGGSAIHDLGAPTLILHGDSDPLLPVAGARALSRRLKGSRYVELQGVGHELLVSRLGPLLDALEEHLMSGTATRDAAV